MPPANVFPHHSFPRAFILFWNLRRWLPVTADLGQLGAMDGHGSRFAIQTKGAPSEKPPIVHSYFGAVAKYLSHLLLIYECRHLSVSRLNDNFVLRSIGEFFRHLTL